MRLHRLSFFAFTLVIAWGCSSADESASFDSSKTFSQRLAAEHGTQPLDYSKADLWACAPDEGDVCDRDFGMARLNTDGTVGHTLVERAESPEVDCFFIYPTLDFNVLQGVNHTDMDSVALPTRTVVAQAGAFNSVCRVIAPYYRQGTFGAYSTNLDQSEWVFTNAFIDVSAAFEYYLRHWNGGRPVIIMGHSQGAQHSSYLLHAYFDGDREVTDIEGSRRTSELRDRLVVGFPLGFNVYVPQGQSVGGAFSDIPVCADGLDAEPQRGCVYHYRSYTEGYAFEGEWEWELDKRMAAKGLLHEPFDSEKHVISCVNPATTPVAQADAFMPSGVTVPAGDLRLLEGTYLTGVMTLLVQGQRTVPEEQHIPGRYTATCRTNEFGGEYLAVGFHRPATADTRGDPIGIAGEIAQGGLGLHIYDFNLALGELIEQVRRRL